MAQGYLFYVICWLAGRDLSIRKLEQLYISPFLSSHCLSRICFLSKHVPIHYVPTRHCNAAAASCICGVRIVGLRPQSTLMASLSAAVHFVWTSPPAAVRPFSCRSQLSPPPLASWKRKLENERSSLCAPVAAAA
jgi:hypothetical protein